MRFLLVVRKEKIFCGYWEKSDRKVTNNIYMLRLYTCQMFWSQTSRTMQKKKKTTTIKTPKQPNQKQTQSPVYYYSWMSLIPVRKQPQEKYLLEYYQNQSGSNHTIHKSYNRTTQNKRAAHTWHRKLFSLVWKTLAIGQWANNKTKTIKVIPSFLDIPTCQIAQTTENIHLNSKLVFSPVGTCVLRNAHTSRCMLMCLAAFWQLLYFSENG